MAAVQCTAQKEGRKREPVWLLCYTCAVSHLDKLHNCSHLNVYNIYVELCIICTMLLGKKIICVTFPHNYILLKEENNLKCNEFMWKAQTKTSNLYQKNLGHNM